MKKIKRATMATLSTVKRCSAINGAYYYTICIEINGACSQFYGCEYHSYQQAHADAREICAALGLKVVKELP